MFGGVVCMWEYLHVNEFVITKKKKLKKKYLGKSDKSRSTALVSGITFPTIYIVPKKKTPSIKLSSQFWKINNSE